MGGVGLRERVQQGDAGGVADDLYAAHAEDVRRFVHFLQPDLADSDDLCQEVWAAVKKGLPAFRFECAPRSWIFAIAKRQVWQARRRRQPQLVPFDSELAERGDLATALGLSDPTTPSRAAHLKQRSAALARALDQLAGDERELLELRFLVDLKPAEIVDVLGLDVTANAVSQRIVRLVRRLREVLRDREEFESFRPKR